MYVYCYRYPNGPTHYARFTTFDKFAQRKREAERAGFEVWIPGTRTRQRRIAGRYAPDGPMPRTAVFESLDE